MRKHVYRGGDSWDLSPPPTCNLAEFLYDYNNNNRTDGKENGRKWERKKINERKKRETIKESASIGGVRPNMAHLVWTTSNFLPTFASAIYHRLLYTASLIFML